MRLSELLKDTTNYSLFVGFIVFLLSVGMLTWVKPTTITKLNDSYNRVINWPRLLLLSVVFGLTASVCAFLIKSKDVVEYTKPSAVVMDFQQFGFNPMY